MIRLLIVDDHELVRAGLRSLLAEASDVEIIGEAGSVAEAVSEAARLGPQVVLMDLRLPDGTGIDACREILSNAPQTRILFLTSYSDQQAVVSTVLAGACGYLLKDIGYQALVGAVRDAAAGRAILEPRITQPVVDRLQRAEALSGQELRVVDLVVQGKTNKQIGAALELSEKTVKNYLSNAFQKLGISRRGEVAALLGTGRIPPE
jgi:two-component system, NarL family, response regulator DevR